MHWLLKREIKDEWRTKPDMGHNLNKNQLQIRDQFKTPKHERNREAILIINTESQNQENIW